MKALELSKMNTSP